MKAAASPIIPPNPPQILAAAATSKGKNVYAVFLFADIVEAERGRDLLSKMMDAEPAAFRIEDGENDASVSFVATADDAESAAALATGWNNMCKERHDA